MQSQESEEVQDVGKKPGDLQRKIQKQMNDMAIRLKGMNTLYIMFRSVIEFSYCFLIIV